MDTENAEHRWQTEACTLARWTRPADADPNRGQVDLIRVDVSAT